MGDNSKPAGWGRQAQANPAQHALLGAEMSWHSLSGTQGGQGHVQEMQQEKEALCKWSGAGLQGAAAAMMVKYLKLRWGNGKTLASVIQESISLQSGLGMKRS